jgi:hypothetical protein
MELTSKKLTFAEGLKEARGGKAGRLRVRFRMGSLEYFIDIILKKARQLRRAHELQAPIFMKAGILNFLEPVGSVQVCTGIA